MEMALKKQQIAHRARQMRRDWSWQGPQTGPLDVSAARAVRRGIQRASEWLMRLSARLGHPLPAGFGIDGPWERSPCLTGDGRYAWVDIAHGLAFETNVYCPLYVRQLAARVDRASSPHQAGGSGGIPREWRQIAALWQRPTKTSRVRPPHARIVRVMWGLSTCHGTIGRHPAQDSKYAQMPLDGIDIVETQEPQREQWYPPRGSVMGIAACEVADFIAAIPWQHRHRVSHRGGNFSAHRYVYVTGSREQRVETMQRLDSVHRTWMRGKLRAAVAATRRACGCVVRGDGEHPGGVPWLKAHGLRD